MYLGVLESFRARLEGKPPTYVPSLGPLAQLTASSSDVAINIASIRDYFARTTSTVVGDEAVAIVLFDLMGTDAPRANPSFAFECIHLEPDFSRWTGGNLRPKDGAEQVKDLVQGSARTAMGGEDFEGKIPRMARLRPMMDPYNYLIEIRAYSKDPTISAFQVAYISAKLGLRGALRVPMADGTYKALPLEWKSFSDKDKKLPAGVGDPGLSAEYLKIWTYQVRGFLDNSDLWAVANLVRRRELSLSSLNIGATSG